MRSPPHLRCIVLGNHVRRERIDFRLGRALVRRAPILKVVVRDLPVCPLEPHPRLPRAPLRRGLGAYRLYQRQELCIERVSPGGLPRAIHGGRGQTKHAACPSFRGRGSLRHVRVVEEVRVPCLVLHLLPWREDGGNDGLLGHGQQVVVLVFGEVNAEISAHRPHLLRRHRRHAAVRGRLLLPLRHRGCRLLFHLHQLSQT
mmetsp:Transcript_42345/g.135585  ORF Transcript_42345/g.135585 Transcript_42345/m.135585 type:complete len:201 (+) Transcript_42345:634-1236(+)